MNVLFCNVNQVVSSAYGTERATLSCARELDNNGFRCVSCYLRSVFQETKENCFYKQYRISDKSVTDELTDIIQKENIEVVIVEGMFTVPRKIRHVHKNVKIIFVHHFEPGWEENFFKRRSLIAALGTKLRLDSKLKIVVKTVLFSLFKEREINKNHWNYKEAYEYSDVVVLLSKSYIAPYQKYGRFHNNNKFAVIPNMLTYDLGDNGVDINEKEKTAIVVTRLEETPKRIFLLLDIWKKITKDSRSKGWNLLILGEGPDRRKYEKRIENDRIKHVTLTGRQEPKEYYKKSSIFLMTSKSEGWGLTLTEAQLFGVVPIAFDTVPVFHDIINDRENGFLVAEGEWDVYTECVLRLMVDTDFRKRIATNAIVASRRFSKTIVGNKWKELLFKL